MLDCGFYNMDCMDGMQQFPDKYFNLAIVDPPYGGVKQGGYMKNQMAGGVAQYHEYNNAIWKQSAPGPEYFRELFRVSKQQIVWGAIILYLICSQHSAGLCGINRNRKA